MIYQKPTFKSIGHGHIIQVNRVVAVIPPTTVTASKYLRRAKKSALFIDASLGRRYRSVLLLDDGCVIASAISVATILKRFSEDLDVDYTDRQDLEEEMEEMEFAPQEVDEQ